MLFSVEPALATDWLFAPSLTARAEVTDNVSQAPDADKESAVILGVTPGFTLRSQGSRRLQVAVNYSLTGVERLGENDTSTDLNHNLAARASAEIVDQFFFVDAFANVSQVLSSLLGAPGGGTLDTGNLTTVGTYSLSPYLTKRFGTFATGLVRYTNSGALFQNDSGGNINSNSLTAALSSGSRFNDLSWGLHYSLRDASTRDGGNNTFEHYDATLGYPITRKIRAFGSVGYDNNDYPSLGKTSGPSWSAGLGWSPTRRTSMDGSVGKNYFGNTFNANFNHRTHFSSWSAQYSEGVNDVAQQLLEGMDRVLWNCTAEGLQVNTSLTNPPFSDCGTSGLSVLQVAQQLQTQGFNSQQISQALLGLGLLNTSLAKGVFLNKSLRGGVSWSKGRNSAGLSVFDTKRIYQDLPGAPNDETRGVTALYGYRLDPRTTLNTSLSYTNNIVPSLVSLSADRNDDIYVASIGLTRQFQRKLTGSLVYRYTTRVSNDSAFDFTENNLTALISKTF